MKDSTSTSNQLSSRAHTTNNLSSATAAAGTSDPGVTVVVDANFKDPMFSSSDTDDCDADKLVIDLDAAASAETLPTPSPADVKLSAAGTFSNSPVAAAAAASKSHPANSSDHGPKSASVACGSGNRTATTATAASSNSSSMSTAAPPSADSADKGLKMKIVKCSPATGPGTAALHEVSQIHSSSSTNSSSTSTIRSPSTQLVGGGGGGQSVSNSSATSSSSKTASSSSSSSSSADKGTAATATAAASHCRIDRTQTAASAQRKDHRQNTAKERNNNKDRVAGASDGPSSSSLASAANNGTSQHLAPASTVSAENNGFAMAGVSGISSSHVVAGEDVVKSSSSLSSSDCHNSAGDGDSMVQSDPYEFSGKQEETVFGRPTKKIKLEKVECGGTNSCTLTVARQLPETRDVSVDACHVGVVTDPDCLGPCEPGTTVTLEGIVWNETENGLLVVNVTWRGKTYVGTLMDATKHHWAPPRFASESPTSDLDGRTPKGRGKRGRTCTAASVRDISDRKLRSNRCSTSGTGKSSSSSSSAAAAGSSSPVRCDAGQLGLHQISLPKKRGASDSQQQQSNGSHLDISRTASSSKPSNRSESRMSVTMDGSDSNGNDGVLIECPAPNCSKKFRHINGLRYHQSRAHPNALSATNDVVGDDADDSESFRHKVTASKSKTDSDILNAELESTSDVEKIELMSEEARLSEKSDRKNKSDRSKSKSSVNTTVIKSADVSDVPGSPAASRPASEETSSAASDKHKHRKKDRSERPKDPAKYSEVAGIDAYRSSKDTAGSGDAALISELDDRHTDEDTTSKVNEAAVATWPSAGSATHTLTAPEVTIEDTTMISDVVTGDTGGTAAEQAGLVPPPLKRPKTTTPTKYGNDENPHSPAYSDISDANDSAPMLEKEGLMSGTVADDDELAALNTGAVMMERCPVTQTAMDTYTPAFTNSGQSSAYGQPPCLTPAVGPIPSLDGVSSANTTGGGLLEKPMDCGVNQNDDRSGTAFSGPKSKLAGDAVGRLPGPESAVDITDRNLGPSPQHLAQLQPSPSQLLPPNFLMQYPHFVPTGSGYPPMDPMLLLQNPEYRAQYERILQQQGVIARPPDLSSSSLVRTPAPGEMPPGFPIPKPGEIDRRGKADASHHVGSLPTPPSLIPDRGSGPFEEHDGRGMKPKAHDRKDDQQRSSSSSSFTNQQQYGANDRQQRRYDDQSVVGTSKESCSGKPSAVVAPQTRGDRMTSLAAPPPSSSKTQRSEDLSRNNLPSSHDQNRPPSHNNKQPSKSIPSAHQDNVSRQSKELSMDRGSRDEKSMVNVARNSSSGTPFKKDDPGMLHSPVASMPLPITGPYPPYYPYLPGQFDPAAFYNGLAASPVMSFTGGAPGPFLHPAGTVGYLPQLAAGDGPAAGSHLSPPDGKSPRDGPQRGFYPVDGSGLPPGSAPHKIHELKNVAKGISGDGGTQQVSGGTGGPNLPPARGDMMQPDARGVVGHPKDIDRTAASPPTQRHVHTHHHTHMLGPLFGGVFAGVAAPMMSTSQAGAPSNPLPRPFIGK